MIYLAVIFSSIFFLPAIAWAEVHITEIAWMGTAESQYSEWLELYNDGENAVNLAGWKLHEGDGEVLVFTFTKSIPAGEYLLLERTTASAPDAVPDVDDEAGAFGGGGLANTGEDLVLTDAAGTTIASLSYSGGWPAGDATTKRTMQWNGSKWITATATPKAGTSSSGGGGGEEEDPEDALEAEPIPAVSPNKPQIEFTLPQTVYRGVPYEFSARPVLEYGYRIDEGVLYWNMGDGTVITQTRVAPITHTYQYPGTYTISFSYRDPNNRHPTLKDSKKVRVASPTIAIEIVEGKALEIKNTSTTPLDLSGWRVLASNHAVAIPDMTVIAEKSTAVIPFIALGIPYTTTLAVIDPSGSVVARSGTATTVQKTPQPPTIYTERESIPFDDTTIGEQELFAETTVDTDNTSPIQNRTKTLIFGAVALFVIGLSILLERFMAQQEYSQGE